MEWFDADRTQARLQPAALIAALRAMAQQGCDVPARQVLSVPTARGESGRLLLMSAWQPGRALGVKVVTVFPDNGTLGLPSVHAVYTLFDARTGVPLAQIDGSVLTSHRTACVSALAASHLARADATRLLVVGAGRIGALLPAAMSAVRPIDEVMIWNRHREGAEALAQRLGAEGLPARAVTDLREAVARAHIVSCATLATEPLVRGDWLQPGTHVDLIGAFTPQMREADGACVARARVFVDQDEALVKAGDLVQARAEGAFSDAALQGTIERLCRGECAGRVRDDDVTLFKSVGSAWQDLAAAQLVAGGPTG